MTQTALKQKVAAHEGKPVTPSGDGFHPYIPASTILPEATLKAIVVGIILAMLLAGSTAYLGLKMGQTVSASIPAAVISMSILRFFRRSNILENNISQTIASAGEAIAGGIIFTIPALVVMGYWQEFGYWQITMIAVVGGSLGVLFSIPLRRALIIEEQLKFPEGVATAEVLKAGDHNNAAMEQSTGTRFLVTGAASASIIKFCQSGLHILGETVHGWFQAGGAVVGVSTGLSLSMIGAGYIIGMRAGFGLLVGALLAWGVGVPLFSSLSSPEAVGLTADASSYDWAMAIRSQKLRFIGVGTMIFGGLYALFSLVGPIKSAVKSSFAAIQKSRLGESIAILRTDHDIPMTTVLLGIAALAVPIFIIVHHVIGSAHLPLTSSLYWVSISFLTVFSLFIGFICAAIGGYIAGIVGSTANPISGITIAAILAVSTAIMLLLGGQIHFGAETADTLSLAATTIIIGGVVATAAALSCDNLQDLKSGHVLGATPWKQQATLLIGVVVGALTVAPILQLLYEAYGLGGVFPRPGMDPAHALAAPQATLMASVANGVFSHMLDWPLVILGIGIGGCVAFVDRFMMSQAKSAYRLSVMAVALGIYLPLEVISALVAGALISHYASRRLEARREQLGDKFEAVKAKAERQGLLFSAGLIAGDAMIGILLAIPFAAYQSTSLFSIVGTSFEETATILGTLVVAAIGYHMYQLGQCKEQETK